MKSKKTKKKIIDLILMKVVNIWDDPKRFKINTCQTDECEHCGKKLGKNPLYVHIMTNGIIVPKEIKEEDIKKIGQESQGCFALTDKCAEQLFGDVLDRYAFRFND